MHYVDPVIKRIYRTPQPENRGGYIRLDQNENPDGVPQWLFDEVMRKVTPETLSMYPEESQLTRKYAEFFGLKEENCTLTDGSVVGMGYVLKVFGEPGKKLLCVSPTFGMYKVYADMQGMDTALLPYEDDYTLNVDKVLGAINDNTGIVTLVNPNMPIGNAYTEQDIISIIEKAHQYDAIVIIDEAYYYFYDKSSLNLVKRYDNVVVLRTFSKLLSIPALRLGVIISNENDIQYINNYKPHYTVNSIALRFGEAIIDHHDRLVDELLVKYRAGRDWLCAALISNGYEFIPSEGCFICVRPKNKDAEKITIELKKRGVLISNVRSDLPGYLRVTVWGKKYMEIFMKTLLEVDTKTDEEICV